MFLASSAAGQKTDRAVKVLFSAVDGTQDNAFSLDLEPSTRPNRWRAVDMDC